MNKTQLLHEAALRLGVRTSLIALVLALAAANVALAVHLMTQTREQRIELQLPPLLSQDAWVSERQVSPGYLIDTGFFFAELALNLSPVNAAHQAKLLSHYAAPEYVGALEQAFSQAEQRLRAENASTVFWPSSYVLDPSGAPRIAITGTLATYVGDKRIGEVAKTYRIGLRWTRWRAALTEFAEADPKQPFAAAAAATAQP